MGYSGLLWRLGSYYPNHGESNEKENFPTQGMPKMTRCPPNMAVSKTRVTPNIDTTDTGILLGFHGDIIPMMDSQMEQQMENDMESGMK